MKKIFFIFIFFPFISGAQNVSLYAGGGASTSEGIPATEAYINDPAGGIFDKYGNYYFVEPLENTARKIDTNGIITTVAGTGAAGYNGDGIPATSAQLYVPNDISIDSSGNLFIADGGNNRIRKIDIATGLMSTVVGTGVLGYSGDGGNATFAMVNDPQCVCFDKFGNMYIGDYGNARGRKVTPSGIISTFVGIGIVGYSGDGSLADTGKIGGIGDIFTDTFGNIYLSDNVISRVFKIDALGIISTIAGTSTGYLYNGDEIAATTANIDPYNIAMDDSGQLFIAEYHNYRVRKIDGSGIIHTIAGNGVSGTSGNNGPATNAEFGKPNGLAFDKCGNLYIPDAEPVNPSIRKVTFNIPDTASISISGITSASIGSIINLTASLSGTGPTYNIQWYDNGVLFTTTTVPSVSFTKINTTDTITAKVIPAGPCNVASVSAAHIIATGTTGINDVSANMEDVSVYPNPVHGSISITGGSIRDVCITDVMGRLVYEERSVDVAKKELTVNAALFPAGIYMVKVNGCFVQRIVTY